MAHVELQLRREVWARSDLFMNWQLIGNYIYVVNQPTNNVAPDMQWGSNDAE